MSWLLRKDLLILRRSRLLLALLVLYPVVIALLIGFAISRSPGKPKVAIVNLSPPGKTIDLGKRKLDVGQFYGGLFSDVRAVRVPTREAAVAKVVAGEVLAAVVIPPDITQALSSVTTQARINVIYNGDALEQSLARSTIESSLAQANLALANQIKEIAGQDLNLLLAGGDLSSLGLSKNFLGLSRIPPILREVERTLPPGAARAQLRRVTEFATFANQNLGVSTRVLTTVSQPIQINQTLVHGRRTPLDSYAVVVAVSISLMFICVLLAAGGIALEREEHVLARLLRGPPALVSREGLLAEKLLLAAVCAFVAAFAMLAAVSAFVGLDWSRVAQWLAALGMGSVAFGSLGVAIGVLAREVRAASLLAFLLSLPLAFLALVPAGAVAGGLYDVIRVISAVFPYKAALQALDAAVNRSAPGLGVSLLHLLGLTAAFGFLARLGLARSEQA